MLSFITNSSVKACTIWIKILNKKKNFESSKFSGLGNSKWGLHLMKKEFLATKTTPQPPPPLTSTTLITNRAVINQHQPAGTSYTAFYLLPFNFVLALILLPPSLLSFSHFTPSCSSILWDKIKKKLISPGQLADW